MYKSGIFLDYSNSLLKKLYTPHQKMFSNNFNKKITSARKLLKFDSDLKFISEESYINLSGYLSYIINDIKTISLKYLEVCMKFNIPDEIIERIIKISEYQQFFCDHEFSVIFLKNCLKIFKKWYKKVELDINPVNNEFKSTLEYSYFILVLSHIQNCLLTKNSFEFEWLQKICNKQIQSMDKQIILQVFTKILKYHKDEKTKKILKKIYQYLEKGNKYSSNNKINDLLVNSDNIQIFNKILFDLDNKKNFWNLLNTYPNYYTAYFNDCMNLCSILDKIDKDLIYFSMENNIIKLNEKLRYYKKFISRIINLLLHQNLKDNINILLDFYIKRILNYKMILFSKYISFKDIDANNFNYMSFFRLNRFFFFVIFYENKFCYSLINFGNMMSHFENLKSIFFELKKSREEKNKTDKQEFFKHRVELENKFQNVLFELQNLLLQGDEKLKELLKTYLLNNTKFQEILRNNFNPTKKNDFKDFQNQVVEEILNYKNFLLGNRISNKKINSFVEDFYIHNTKLKNTKNKIFDLYDKKNVIHLIISSELANIPIENLPLFYKLPIIRILNHNYISVPCHKLIKTKNIFYMINPAGDLKSTEECLTPLFEDKLKLSNGIVGKEPNKQEVISKLSKSDMFFYSGHSNGCKYIDANYLKYLDSQQEGEGVSELSTSIFLLGCSSLKIENSLGYDAQPLDIASYYQIKGTPCIIGCLWEVTDVDLDAFTRILVERLLINKGKFHIKILFYFVETDSIIQAILYAKHYCKLQFLNSASIVVYSHSDFQIKLEN